METNDLPKFSLQCLQLSPTFHPTGILSGEGVGSEEGIGWSTVTGLAFGFPLAGAG